ncbi:MAG: DUF1801 domain-containing protein [Gammaproteobacteria bacterium]|nr:DUF1801 domain-containing protein [Gammaproteobacteria bacterium]
MLELRELIFQTASAVEGAGEIQETLKWGEPAYLTTKTRAGTTVRIGWKANAPERYAMYFHCQTNLIDTFRTLFPDDLRFEGNRAIVFDVGESIPREALSRCVAAALTYHLRKRKGKKPKPRTSR